MKFYLAIVFVTIVVAVNAANIDIPDAHKEKAKQIVDECRTKFVIPDEEFAKFKAGEIAEPNETLKCFTNCFQEKAGISKDGVFQEEAVEAKFSPTIGQDKVKSIIAACRGESGSDKCDTSYKMHLCFKKNGAY